MSGRGHEQANQQMRTFWGVVRATNRTVSDSIRRLLAEKVREGRFWSTFELRFYDMVAEGRARSKALGQDQEGCVCSGSKRRGSGRTD